MPGGLTLLASSAAAIPTPASGKVTIFFNTTTLLPSYKDDAGVVHSLIGAVGPQGSVGIQGEIGDEPDIVLALPGPQGNPGPTGAQGPMGVSIIGEEVTIEDMLLSTPRTLRDDFWDAEVIKKNNTTVTNSAAYVEDAELRYQLVASGIYLVEAFITFSGNTTVGDYKWEWRMGAQVASAAQWDGYWLAMGTGPTNESATNAAPNAFWGNLTVQMPLASHEKFVMHHRFTIVVPSSTASDFLLVYRFAQAAATVGTDAITYAGSRFRIKKLN